MSIQSRLSTCAAAKWVTIIRHICAFPSGANRQIYAASIGMNNEIIASGTPIKILLVQESFPSVASAGTSTTATGIQVYLFTPPTFDFGRSAKFVMASSVADLHASKNRRAHHDQSLLRLVRVGRPGIARRIRISAKDSLPPRRHIPGFWNAQLDAAKERIRVQHRLVPRNVRVAQVNLNSAEERLQLPTAKLFCVHALLYTAKDSTFIQRGERIAIVRAHRVRHFPRLQRTPHSKSAGRNQHDRPHFAPRKMSESQLIHLQEHTEHQQHRAPGPPARIGQFYDSRKDQNQRPELEEVPGSHDSQIVEQENRADGQN